jgi:TrmH family RNA methyltransferase
MLSKSKIKWIRSLEQKKNRDDEQLFVVEGFKIITELLPVMKCRFLAFSIDQLNNEFKKYDVDVEQISADEYQKITFQKSPQGVLAVFEKPKFTYDITQIKHELNIALDDIQDPGNLGTIVRLADWFGIRNVFCSQHTADIFSPKAVQATMGAIARVKVHYVDLNEFLKNIKAEIPIYGTFMNGENIYSEKLSRSGIIVMGNEGNGISAETEKLITQKIAIPSFPSGVHTSESLNVSIAAAIIVSEFRRREIVIK